MAEEKQNTEQLRAQAAVLLAQARSQAASVQHALQAAGADGAVHSELAGAADQLSGVINDLESALQSAKFNLRAADLSGIRSIVQSGIIGALVSQASAQASAQAAARTVAATAAETRTETQSIERDVFDRKIFDRYLHFASPDDEAAYRKREAEARQYIDAQLAKRSPEGDLNAGGGMIGQMLDAHAHGAGNSPEFLPRWSALVDKTTKQRAAMHAAGQKTEEFDGNLNTAVRRFLKAKGLSDAEIDAKLASGTDPLEAVKPYIGNDHASQQLERAATASVEASPADRAGLPTTSTTAGIVAPSGNVTSIGDSLKAAGVQMAGDTLTGSSSQVLPGAKAPGRAAPSLPA